MKCPYCKYLGSRVTDSRIIEDDTTVRRRRECIKCSRRFSTYERIEEPIILVIKKDQRRERFDRKKILNGIMRACEKRPISIEIIDTICSKVEIEVRNRPDKEISSMDIGSMVMDLIKELDHVAYVRFASVYKEFEDIGGFQSLLEGLAARRQ